MCVLTLHSESLHCSCQVESFFRVKEFPPPPVLVTSSGNDADGFRGICTLGGWTRLQHLYGPRIWGPRRVSLVDRWPCRADPSQVCGWHDKQQSGSHGDSWISDKVKEFPPPPVLVTSSGNDADGFRGICTLGGWTRLQHLYGPRIWGPRRVSLVDRWPCRADPSQVCGWHDKQQSGSHGDSWISDKVGKCSLRKIP